MTGLTSFLSNQNLKYLHFHSDFFLHKGPDGKVNIHEPKKLSEYIAKYIDLSGIVNSLGASKMFKAESPNELKQKIKEFLFCSEPSFLEVKIQAGSRDDLGRPTKTPVENKVSFMKFIED